MNAEFLETVLSDSLRLEAILESQDSPGHRRDFIRAVFAAIEGTVWHLKEQIPLYVSLSEHELSALTEETWIVDDRGNIRTTTKFVPLPSSIKLIAKIALRYAPQFSPKFDHVGWNALLNSIEVRNRLVHPKKVSDFVVSDSELLESRKAISWLIFFAGRLIDEQNEILKGRIMDLAECAPSFSRGEV